jgi:hypothetical protein
VPAREEITAIARSSSRHEVARDAFQIMPMARSASRAQKSCSGDFFAFHIGSADYRILSAFRAYPARISSHLPLIRFGGHRSQPEKATCGAQS